MIEEVKETLAVKIARLETKVDSLISDKIINFIVDNKEQHKEIICLIKELKTHVNDENEKMDVRIKACEDILKTSTITWKVLVKVGTTTITVIGVAIALIKLLLGV